MTTLAKSRFFNKDKRVAAIFTDKANRLESGAEVKKEIIYENDIKKEKVLIKKEEKPEVKIKAKKKATKKEEIKGVAHSS